jgi:S-DNA-T family DNA segregation ATPase FtsK/SpoIIIE
VLGRDIAGQAIVADLISMPHLLIAGATGSGKSVMINTFLLSLLYRNSPADLKLILVDPKRVELSLYEDIPHLLAPVIVEPEKCISALKWATAEMERRYSVFAEQHKRNIGEYNSANKTETMPYIVVVIDELADLMSLAANDVEGLVVRLAQKARATGIHLVLATQRPSVNVITGLIKANVPARIAFSTVSQVDSRTIIDQAGAEKLLGRGDMLFLAPDFVKSRRIQGVLIDEKEVKGVTDFLRKAREPQYNEEVLTQDVRLGGAKGSFGDVDDVDDSLFLDAAQLVIESRKASASLLQRRLRVGYARAARLLDMLEERGIVSAPDGSRPRDVLATSMGEVMGEDGETET